MTEAGVGASVAARRPGLAASGRPAAAGRLTGLDAARGLAILGMITAHIWLTDGEKLVDGRSSILFATIAGMSLGLMTRQPPPVPGADPGDAARWRRRGRIVVVSRAGLIFGLGAILSVLFPPLAVILDDYAICFLLLLPLLYAPRWVLLLVAAVLAAVGPLLVAAAREADVFPASIVLDTVGSWPLTGVYPAAVFLVFLLLGLVAARSDLRHLGTRLVLIAGGSALGSIGYGAALLVPGVSAEAHSGSTAEILGSGGLALAVVGVLLLLCDSPWPLARPLRIALWPLAAAGSMPLTIYTVHVVGMVVAAAVATAVGTPYEYGPWLLPVMLLGALALGSVLRATTGTGPLELAMSRVVALTADGLPSGGPARR